MSNALRRTVLGWGIVAGLTFGGHCVAMAADVPNDGYDRLLQFRSQRGRQAGPEFERPIDEVIDELLAEKNRPLLEMLCEVLRSKTLSAKQVERLIQAARTDTSDAHRFYLWRVLWGSQSEEAIRYLEEAVARDADDSTVLGFFESLRSVQATNVDLLTKIHQHRENELIRNAIVNLGGSRLLDFRHDGAQTLLLAWIVRHDEDVTRKIAALRAAYNRAGVNTSGRQLTLDTLQQEEAIEVRKAIYVMLMESWRGDHLARLLGSDETEEVIVAGLKTYGNAIRSAYPSRQLSVTHADLLHRVSEQSPSAQVRQAASDVLKAGCDTEARWLSDSIGRQRQFIERVLHSLDALDAGREIPPESFGSAEQLEASLRRYSSPNALENELQPFRTRYQSIRTKYKSIDKEQAVQIAVEEQIDAHQLILKELIERVGELQAKSQTAPPTKNARSAPPPPAETAVRKTAVKETVRRLPPK